MNSKKIKILLKNKKFLIVFVLICLVVSYFVFKLFFSDKPVVSYTTVKIEKGTLISNVSSSGQVVSLDQTDVKSKTSGTIVYKNLKNGTKVNKGDLLLQLDTSEAQKDV
ncbi:MAG TPA: HlyD family efflux transporter periplasmic adaptor subunit [Candidatus Paceibacterota bacterium]|jgi:HlyD family secretion protein|nr:HlyD family efflux transporter periplasmic adaptor subunit [Candidatus Paceibacterota bacterium]HRZ29719.1 HlyD family efflux transporter periplasmic adaptor subunit [Candidatus Paceibacterota bacterium]